MSPAQLGTSSPDIELASANKPQAVLVQQSSTAQNYVQYWIYSFLKYPPIDLIIGFSSCRIAHQSRLLLLLKGETFLWNHQNSTSQESFSHKSMNNILLSDTRKPTLNAQLLIILYIKSHETISFSVFICIHTMRFHKEISTSHTLGEIYVWFFLTITCRLYHKFLSEGFCPRQNHLFVLNDFWQKLSWRCWFEKVLCFSWYSNLVSDVQNW